MVIMVDRLVHENIQSLATFSRIFSYEFLIKNVDRIETAFYNSKANLICVMYKHRPNKNLIIGISNLESDGVFIGYYGDDGSPAIEGADHYIFIPFNGVNNVKAIISQKVKTLFDIDLDL